MIAPDLDVFEECGAAAVPFEAQRLAAADHETAEDALLLAARFVAATPPRDLWRHPEGGPKPMRRHDALELARRIAGEEQHLLGFVRWVDGKAEALVRGRGWAWRHRGARGQAQYLPPGGREWVPLHRAAEVCRAEVLREEREALEAAAARAAHEGPRVVRGDYDQRQQRGDDDVAQPPAPDEGCDSVHAPFVAPPAAGGMPG